MKLSAVILSVLLLLSVSLNSIILAHFNYNFEYIITELCVEKEVKDSCCKGSCHLAQEFSKSDNSKHQQPQSFVQNFDLLNWFYIEPEEEVSAELTSKSSILCSDSHLLAGVSAVIDHPPCV